MIDTARTVCLCIAMLVLSAACSTRTDAGTDPLTKRGCSSAQSEVPAPSTALSVVPPPPTSLTYAEVCATYDPVNHPEQVQKILEYASGVTGTPVDVLFAVWWKETKQLGGAGRASGGCPVMAELKLRDAAAGTHHGASMLRMGEAFGWTKAYGSRLERMTCSCPGRDPEGERRGYGGCCGPFQFSAAEVERPALANGLDPMKLCSGAIIVGWELKRYHDEAFTPTKRGGRTSPGRGQIVQKRFRYKNREHAAWHAAMSRYYGADEEGTYGRTAVYAWREFHKWHKKDLEQPGFLAAKILNLASTRYSQAYLKRRTLTLN